MSFVDVDFTTGDTVEEADLDQLSENLTVVREESNYYPILTSNYYLMGTGLTLATVKLYIDGDLIDTYTGAGFFSTVNELISSLSVGIHTIGIAIDAGETSPTWHYSKFYRSPEMLYLSAWLRVEQNYLYIGGYSNDIVEVRGLSVIGHRQSKSW